MSKVFINHSNHPICYWQPSQLLEAKKIGEPIDFPFPIIDSSLTETEIDQLVNENLEYILQFHPTAVMCQGEFTYTYRMVSKLKAHGISVVAACSNRVSEEIQNDDGSTSKTSVFNFVKFRQY